MPRHLGVSQVRVVIEIPGHQVDKPRDPVTVTSTIVQTITHIATQRATIFIAEVETSTILSTSDVTISTAATQTSVVWETTTAAAKRAATGLQRPRPGRGGNQPSTSQRPAPIVEREGSGSSDPTPIPKKARQEAAPTVTKYVTETVDTTSISSVMITVHTTSTEVTTVYQTNTQCVSRFSCLDRP